MRISDWSSDVCSSDLQPAETATIASTSTAAFKGRQGTPTALRAWRPASPNTSTITSDAPLATFGWSVKDGAEATNAPSFNRSDKRRVGTEGGSTFRSRWSTYN